jgi:serine O-acetyltransferase
MEYEDIKTLAREFRVAFDAQLAGDDSEEVKLPNRAAVEVICRHYLDVLLPVLFEEGRLDASTAGVEERRYLDEMRALLREQMCRAIRFDLRRGGATLPADLEDCAGKHVDEVFRQLPELSRLLASDIEAAFHNDPAAPSREEILLSYPSVEAITVQRLAHRLYLMDVPFIPRMMTEVAHNHTGIDIHPGASIGESFFIDHGTGVVIGETATIGDKVTLYHGVTLGAFNPLIKDEHGQPRRGQANKRHPDLEDHVTVYPNATILGGRTRIGRHSVIGGNVWLTHSVAPYSKVTLKEPELVILNGESPQWVI